MLHLATQLTVSMETVIIHSWKYYLIFGGFCVCFGGGVWEGPSPPLDYFPALPVLELVPRLPESERTDNIYDDHG